MPGGRRNPLSLSRVVEVVKESKHKAREAVHHKLEGYEIPLVDLEIQFIGASGLPKLDVVGSCDPYFVAKLDDKITFVSNVKPQTLTPVWNEHWRIRNVPSSAELVVELLDKDEGQPHDDYIGKFKASVAPGPKEVEITHSIMRSRGTFWLKITSTRSPHDDSPPLYMFDGPIRYSRHFSPTVGRFTNLNDARLYSTWKIFLRGVPLFFGSSHQHWNTGYKNAQSIFGSGPAALAVRSGIQAGHSLLYARTSHNGTGVIEDANDVLKIMKGSVEYEGWTARTTNTLFRSGSQGGEGADETQQQPQSKNEWAHRVKPAVYTYIISSEDDSLRFSETGAAFFVDFASKHALHSNCATNVRYSGEFHPRPKGGWENFSDDIKDEDVHWELIIDNNSGTYAPDKGMLPKLKELLEYNFPGFGVFAYDREDDEMIRSREACREYAVRCRGVKKEDTLGGTAPLPG